MFLVISSSVTDCSTFLRESLLGQKIQNNLLALVKQTPKDEHKKIIVFHQTTKRSDF